MNSQTKSISLFVPLIMLAFLVTACIVEEQHPIAPHDDATLAEQTEQMKQADTCPDADYDPLAVAVASIGQTRNLEAGVPSQCYTKTDGIANPCWTCHTAPRGLNQQADWELQEEYAFSDVALTNHWSNLYVDRSNAIAAISDDEMREYIGVDNYTPLIAALQEVGDFPGFVPDLDFTLGFDEDGFAMDGSGWRAIRYKPFLGTFWPTNGTADDVFIRLPREFRVNEAGSFSRPIYQINLAILEAVINGDPRVQSSETKREVEPISEIIAGIDLNGDGDLSGEISWIHGIPKHYVGGARQVRTMRYAYPKGSEFMHTLRYVDMDNPSLLSTRMKEVRYSRKQIALDLWGTARQYEIEYNEKENGFLPVYRGSPLVGLMNGFGWQLQGYIEDEEGWLRLQTEEEHRFCMGCHSAIGVTVDQTFTMARKVPGRAGWRHQDLAGIPDVPQVGHEAPEILTYFERVRGGDEFRANDEILERFFPNSQLDKQSVLRAAPGGDMDITHLIVPSRERAALLNKAYMTLVNEQTFELGRDPIIAPPTNVHAEIENGSTELGATGQVYKDGVLWLDWSNYKAPVD